MYKKEEKGAIVVEATISLTAFILAIFTILMLVDICYIQAKIGTSLNTTAKEISQYAYLYYKFNSDEFQSQINGEAAASRKTAENTIEGIGAFMDSMSGASDSLKTGDFNKMAEEIKKGGKEVDSLVQMYGNELEDPKAFILGMASLAKSEGIEFAKNELFGKLLGRSFMKKNLVVSQNDNADSFLKRNRVVGGLNGLDFKYTSLMAYGETDEIRMVVTYEVEVIKLLNIDFKFKFTQTAKTRAWGNGVSLISPREEKKTESTIWDSGSTNRGKTIVLEEKKNFTYTDSGHGYDAYNNNGGANEFITITSINTHDKTYQTVNGIKNRLSTVYNDTVRGVSKLGEEITVTGPDGSEVKVVSPTDTRTYKIILVVPDDADMSLVNQAVEKFKESKAGNSQNVVVEVKTGYGSPTHTEEGEE